MFLTSFLNRKYPNICFYPERPKPILRNFETPLKPIFDFRPSLTFNGSPEPKCIDSFCILNHVLKPRPSTYLPLLLSMFVLFDCCIVCLLLFVCTV